MQIRSFTNFLKQVVKLLEDNGVQIRYIFKLDSISNLSKSKRYLIYESASGDIDLMEFQPNLLENNLIYYDPHNDFRRILHKIESQKCVIEKVGEGVYDIYVKDRLEGLYLRSLLNKR